MTLLTPAWLWTAGALVLVALLHLMQSRWKRRVVGSLMIWRRVAARGLELRACRPTLDLALLVGLAGAAALVMAAAGPRLVASARAGREVVVVLDNGTASLTENPAGRDRFHGAAALAAGELAPLDAGARAAVVATSPSPRVVAPMGGPAEARAALLGKVRPCQVTGSLPAAVSLALAQGGAQAEVVVLTSRALPSSPARVRRVAVGRESANVGVIHADFSDARAFVAVRSFAAQPVEARVSLKSIGPDARELAFEEVSLAPLGRADVLLEPGRHAPAALAGARAVAVEVAAAGDDLAADDVAFAARSGGGVRTVGLVGDPGEAFLRALWAARVETVALAGGGVPGDMSEDIDALVYASEVPPSWPPPVPTILVAPEESVGPLEMLDDELRDVRAMFAGGEGRATPTRGFPPTVIAVGRARRVRILGAAEPLLESAGESGGEVLAARVASGGAPVVYIGFRPEDSDWPERASFPVFVARVLEGLEPGKGEGGRLGFARVGDVAARHLPRGVREAFPPGRAEVLRSGRLLEAGLYRAGGLPLAVNLVSETESDNRPAPEAPVAATEAPRARRRATASWDLGGALAAAALALLAAEWLVSARRS
ncbi:MAG: hypothetical protein ACYTKD_22105 [Planctomycetota bacterium]|jgi:hypothetical protein